MHPFARGDDPGFRKYLAAVQRYPILDRAAELKLARRFRHKGDRKAADALVQANLRYVVKIAAQYRGYGFRLSDLVEEGNLGLLEAVLRFDPGRKLRFMTYAAYWVRAYVLAHVLKQWSIVGVGTGPLQSKMFFRLHRERSRLSSQLGVEGGAMDTTLAHTFNTSEEKVRQMAQRLDSRDASLDMAAYRDGSTTLLETLSDESPNQEEHTAAAERDARVRRHLAQVRHQLDERERMILEERLLSTDDEVTLADLGRRMGLSRERVRQLEERVKHKLRRALSPVQDTLAA
jgi:RNA polymerase sigma-32 factor